MAWGWVVPQEVGLGGSTATTAAINLISRTKAAASATFGPRRWMVMMMMTLLSSLASLV